MDVYERLVWPIRARSSLDVNSVLLAYDRCGTATSQLVSQSLCTPRPLPTHPHTQTGSGKTCTEADILERLACLERCGAQKRSAAKG